ncbi:similar to Saccharomyces cerevisiae YBR267W REI1 Cytoplasmic pre-60S factor [Maudiozyma barnettii]|uniref:Similar to Saccharomyces cerevisiae YBR267W REI1 Cytoplasmic pre-60S factor n=1 Tax=Maudiozyma barnettii TaxID=61262 RepID=A0A8H2ZI33_9SACH|nr:Rei1p [Kazachstania barnettii]CAB4254553.1 similar to Saccharomyces cerevisiae YBR267W REI1 Cytoplasmic pre-60S factor [Kazachstania barnettii]CAD1782595.1 similar to Saccharomyces cerevisiae YBR267W REI1 Cytoplasmic pre-60S factor [Kazachstania barnettii]
MSGIYTCNSCSIAFETGQDQRNHMKTEWHRYNLKRRVAQLPAISEQVFNSKVNSLSKDELQDEQKKKKDDKRQMTKKDLRRKEKEALLEKKKKLLALAKENMLKNMALQQKVEPQTTESTTKSDVEEPVLEIKTVPTDQEKDKESQVDSESISEENLTEEELAERLMKQKLESQVEIKPETCLFCTNKTFPDFESNLKHMFESHGFYIPEQKYLTDKEGLVKYMSEKIGLGNVCIVCNYEGRSLPAVRAHMLAKRHCKIPFESENERLEISEFYDFTSSYQDSYTNSSVVQENEEDWEDVPSDDENGTTEATDDKVDEEEEYVPEEYLYNDGVQLHLPNGVKIGHRSLQRYFKQNLKPEKELTEGQGTLVAAETRTFLPAFDKKGYQVRQRVWQTENKDKKREDKRAAKFVNNQPYYRDQLLQ